MIVLHRVDKEDSFADRIEEILDELVVAYKIKEYANSDHLKADQKSELPLIEENNTIITGKDEINAFLEELRAELKQQRSIRSDACYIDPESGQIC